MPTSIETESAFDRIVENALDFIEASVRDLEQSPKFSVVHFAIGLELLLKARLFNEHWTLIAAEPHKASWTELLQGKVVTVQASSLCSYITKVSGENLKTQDSAFKAAFDHRNRVLHLMPVGNQADIVTEQFRAWYQLHRLLERSWAAIFSKHQSRLAAVETALMTNRKYLSTRYEQQQETLLELAAGGYVAVCPLCAFDAAVISSNTVTAPSAECRVCRSTFTAVTFGCGYWNVIDDTLVEYSCKCGTIHLIDGLVAQLDPTTLMRPKEQIIAGPGRYHCGTCLSHDARVVWVDEGLVCLGCGTRYGDIKLEACEYCNELWAGYDTELSWFNGCEFCDGHDPN